MSRLRLLSLLSGQVGAVGFGITAAVVTFLPISIGLRTATPERGKWLYLWAGLAALLAGVTIYAKSLVDTAAQRGLQAEATRLAAERANVARRLTAVAALLGGLWAKQFAVDTFIGHILKHLHASLSDLGTRRVSFLAYRSLPVENRLHPFHSNSTVKLTVHGLQAGDHTPAPWDIDESDRGEVQTAEDVMGDARWETILRIEDASKISGAGVHTLRPAHVSGMPCPASWCRAGVAAGGQPIGILCVDIWQPYAWNEADLKIVDAFATILGLAFR